MPLTEEIVKQASQQSDMAIVVIGIHRTSAHRHRGGKAESERANHGTIRPGFQHRGFLLCCAIAGFQLESITPCPLDLQMDKNQMKQRYNKCIVKLKINKKQHLKMLKRKNKLLKQYKI